MRGSMSLAMRPLYPLRGLGGALLPRGDELVIEQTDACDEAQDHHDRDTGHLVGPRRAFFLGGRLLRLALARAGLGIGAALALAVGLLAALGVLVLRAFLLCEMHARG